MKWEELADWGFILVTLSLLMLIAYIVEKIS